MSTYPGIERAALELAYANGGINAARSEAQHKRELRRFLAKTPHTTEEMKAMDVWFAGLSDRQVTTAVDGEERAMKRLYAKAPPWSWKLICDLFEEVC